MKLTSFLLIFALAVCATNVLALNLRAVSAEGGEDHIIVELSDTSFSANGIGDSTLGTETGTDKYILNQILSGEQSSTEQYFLNVNAYDGGWYHSIAIDDSGQCYTWGKNENMCLGIGLTSSIIYRSEPVKVYSGQQNSAPDTYLTNITAVAADRSGTHCLAIEATTGYVLSWGNDVSGQLGDGDLSNDHSVPNYVILDDNDPNNTRLGSITAVSAGAYHSMALNDLGRVYCFGNDEHGQLGNDTNTTDFDVPVLVASGAQSDTAMYLENIIAIDAGWNHSLALEANNPNDNLQNGRVLAWGGVELMVGLEQIQKKIQKFQLLYVQASKTQMLQSHRLRI